MAIARDDLRSRAYTSAIATADSTAIAGPCRVFGAMIASATDAMKADVRNGAATNSDVVFSVSAIADSMGSVYFGPNGIRLDTGLTVTLEAGTTPDITVWYMEE